MSKSQYDAKAKDRIMRYMAASREKMTLNFPKGTKDRYRAYAEFKGQSLTSLFQELIEYDIENNPDYDEEYHFEQYMNRKAEAEKQKEQAAKEKTVSDK